MCLYSFLTVCGVLLREPPTLPDGEVEDIGTMSETHATTPGAAAAGAVTGGLFGIAGGPAGAILGLVLGALVGVLTERALHR